MCAGFVIRAVGLVGRQFAKFLQFRAVFLLASLAGLRDGRTWFHSLCKNGLKNGLCKNGLIHKFPG